MSQNTAGLRQERRELKYNYIPTATQSPEIAANMISCISGAKTFNMAGLQASAVIFPNTELKAKYDRFIPIFRMPPIWYDWIAGSWE